MSKYGDNIREIREKHNHSREDLAKRLGISLSAMGKYERGERGVSPDLMEKIAAIYDVPLSSLYGEEGELPNELKELGVEWITFAKDMKEKNITPEQLKATIDLIRKLKLDNNM